jgi:hypothetical protein
MCEPDATIFRAFRAVVMLLGDEKLQQDLCAEEHSEAALGKMEIPHAARGELLSLLNRVEQLKARPPVKVSTLVPAPVTVAGTELSTPGTMPTTIDAAPAAPDDRYERMQLEAFDHIRMSFWVALLMSIGLFVVGLVLMGCAVFQALREKNMSTSTFAIAGLGLADFVLLFFRRPWQDVSVNLSNSQQVRTIATSYLVGLALLQRRDTGSLGLLNELTKRSVEMLERYAEERDSEREHIPNAAKPSAPGVQENTGPTEAKVGSSI